VLIWKLSTFLDKFYKRNLCIVSILKQNLMLYVVEFFWNRIRYTIGPLSELKAALCLMIA